MSKKKRRLQDRDLELLLAWLDPYLDRAADEHVRLHIWLTRHFTAHGCIEPEGLADATLHRVGAILSSGKDLSAYNRQAYLMRVAYYVRHEYWREHKPVDPLPDRGADLMGDGPSSASFEFDAFREKEHLHSCLEECLDTLAPEGRLLLLEYYSEDKTAKIGTRDRMATGLGISSGALRQRTSKLRDRVRICVLSCIG